MNKTTLIILALTPFALLGYSKKNNVTFKKILIIHSLEEVRPWNNVFNNQFKESLKHITTFDIELASEYTDLILYKSEEYKNILENSLRYKYQNDLPDVIVLCKINAVQFIIERNLFPDIPKVLIDVSNKTAKDLPNAIVINHEYYFKPMIEHALSLFPKTKKIYVITAHNELSNHTLKLFNRDINHLKDSISFNYLANLSKNTLLDSVKNLPENSLVYHLSFTQDLDGKSVMAKEFSMDLATNCNRPVFCFSDILAAKTGILGGLVVSTNSKAIKAVKVIKQIFNGQNIEHIPNQKADYIYNYDWKELKRWNISHKRLPSSSVFYHRKFTFFELHKAKIYWLLAILISYTALLVLLLYTNNKKKLSQRNLKLENEKYERLNSEYRAQNKQLKIEKERAEESDRLKLAFLLNMSHEIRTPINSMVGFSELLKDDTLNQEQRNNYIKIIINGSFQLLRIIDDILEMSR
ncbi:histidine kinase dimerization/phospho-acceptor domain-containing protein [Saccharicrinis fermentans]|uniref:histidine kinase n=3 Tax=Saccharicrinis fermentans TaxID=982 RepID=W7Y9D2_9BACT|nr:histidine kinase dimerization/phospho-acceptor domain-containing protein [Saccharicrinis fermentans]GAF04098.1 autoinducer 2 sensor kinase/phosphatase LuxQ [Saccharicrinis fermentans DSM 9555 = JCM 21142]